MAETQTLSGVQDPPAPSSETVNFEDACIDLLCKQENALALLSEASKKRRALDSLDLAKKMLVQFLDFAETHFDPTQIQIVGQSLYVVNQRTREYERLLVAKWYRFLRRIAFLPVPNEEELRQAYDQLRGNYVELFNEFFAICSRRLPQDSEMQEQFGQSVETYLSEFKQRW